MIYVQFQTLSSGYIPNTIPPQYSDEHKKRVDMLGSNGVCILDGRLKLSNAINEALEVLQRRNRNNNIVSFKIVKAERFSDNGTVLYQHENF